MGKSACLFDYAGAAEGLGAATGYRPSRRRLALPQELGAERVGVIRRRENPGGGARGFCLPGRREGGELMTGVTVRESVKVAGLVERVRAVRSFVGAVLGPGHPCGDDAILLASELFANGLRHSSSGLPGETVTVTADVAAVRVEVADRSGSGVPELRPAGSDAEDGRGLGIVERLADRWGWRRRGGRTVTWFVLRALLQQMQQSAAPDKSSVGHGEAPIRR